MSARAAWRLDALGFTEVHRYQPGKDDWLVARLPLEGRQAGILRAADIARPDVPTCGLDDDISALAEAMQAGDWPLAVVVNDARIVLGRVRPRDLERSSSVRAKDIMLDGPRTIRGTLPASEVGAWLDERKVPGVLVTSADGELVGYVRRADV
jgi:CBS domain-containing protein